MARRSLVYTVKICPYCKQEFHPFNSTQKFCSYKCLYDYRYEIKREADCTKPKKCLYCGEDFKPSNYRSKYCSRKCFISSVTKKRKIVCPTCGIEFIPVRVGQKYCSRNCGEPAKRSGKVKKGYIDLLWGNLVKLMAGAKCEYCGKTNNLNSHHIFSRSRLNLRWDTDNGVCLCASHHTLGNFSAHKAPIDFIEWLKEKRGEDWYNKLREKSRVLLKYSDADRVEIAQSLKGRIATLT